MKESADDDVVGGERINIMALKNGALCARWKRGCLIRIMERTYLVVMGEIVGGCESQVVISERKFLPETFCQKRFEILIFDKKENGPAGPFGCSVYDIGCKYGSKHLIGRRRNGISARSLIYQPIVSGNLKYFDLTQADS